MRLFLAPGALSGRGPVYRRAPARASDPRPRCLAFPHAADALAERPVREPLYDVADLCLGRELPQVSWYASPIHKPTRRREPAYLSLIHISEPTRLGMIS